MKNECRPDVRRGIAWMKLTQGQETCFDLADLDKVAGYRWYAAKTKSTGSFYAQTTVLSAAGKPRSLLMHVFIFGGSREVDHKDRDGLNNSRSNLRPATRSQNCINQRLRSHNKSGFRGVSKHSTCAGWVAHVMKNRKPRYLGYFKTPVAAAVAYDIAAVELHGEFAQLNFPV